MSSTLSHGMCIPRSTPARRFTRLLAGWLLAAAVVLPGRLAATEVEPLDLSALGAPSFESFTARDGLPDGVVVAIGVDAEGFAWVASPRGLYRFVGHRWQRELGPEAGRLYKRLWLDDAGALWAPSLDAGVPRLQDGRWTLLEAPRDMPAEQIYRVSQTRDSAGRLRSWLLTQNGGLFERVDGQWRPDPGNASLPPGVLQAIASTTRLYGEPREWLATGGHGVWFRREGDVEWQPFDLPGLKPGQTEDLQRTVDIAGESLWISVFSEGLYRVTEDGAQSWTVDNGGLRASEIYTISTADAPGGETVAWVASRDGLVRVQGGRSEIFDRRHGLPSDQIRDTHLWSSPSGEQVLWIATEAGVARAVLTADRWRTASLMGSGALGVFGVLVEPDGHGGERLWVASNRDGLGLYEDGRWQQFSSQSGELSGDRLRLVERAPDLEGENALWLGIEEGPLMRVDAGPRFSEVETPWPMRPGEVAMDVLAREHNGRRELWFATRTAGIYRWRDDGWSGFGTGPGEAAWGVTSLAEQIDEAGRSWLWAATYRGLARFDGSEWMRLAEIPGLPQNTVIGLTLSPSPDGDGQVLWIGSVYDGLIRLDVTDPLAPQVMSNADLPPPIDVTVYSALHDSKGRVYLCTNDGVQQLTPRPEGGWSERVFRRRDGMVHEECNTNAQFIDRHDRFWTGTLGGLTVFDPGSPLPVRPKQLRLVGVRVDNREVEPHQLRLGPQARELHVEYTLQSWQREDETRYRTQLIGFDPEPGQWTAQPTRTVTALPPGDYRLRIEARDYAGNLAEPLTLAFEVAPAWWQRRSVELGFALVGSLLLVAAAQWRTRSLRRQKDRLEAQVAARTEQLITANARLLELSYTDGLTGLANRRMLLEHLRSLTGTSKADAPCSLIFVDVDNFKEYNDRLGHPAGDEALCCVAKSLKACAPSSAIVARYGGEEFACLLHGYQPEQAAELAERMRRDMERRPIPVPGCTDREYVTISAGVATVRLQAESDIHRLLREADQALYRAKNAGRNRVRTSGPSI